MMVMMGGLLLLFMFSMGNAADQDEKCPCGWRNSGSRCFKFFSTSVNWVTAEKNCQGLGANLATVRNKVENDFLLSLVTGDLTRCWIGGYDAEDEEQWFWTAGSPFGYTNWCSGEPNNKNTEHCLEINWTANHCWNNTPCSSAHGYICARNLI